MTSSLADAIGQAILDADGVDRIDVDDPGHRLELVRRAAEADRVSGDLLHQAVVAARGGGESWAAIGAALGLTRQATQQRFGKADPAASSPTTRTGAPDDPAPRERWLGPVTALDEMAELTLAGRLGWHTVGAGMLRHRMVRTDTSWEHKRLFGSGSLARHEAEGWQIGCRAFPWIYLIRDTGHPVEPEGPGAG